MDVSDDESSHDETEPVKYGAVSVVRSSASAGQDHGIGGLVEEDGKKIQDLTGHETPSFEEPLDPDVWEVDYTNTRLKVFPTHILPLKHLEILILRMNLLTTNAIESALSLVTPTLTHLDLYDNQLKAIPSSMTRLTNLTTLDLSFNKIKAIENVESLSQLTELYLANNRISVLPIHLAALTKLVTLELGSNSIRKIESLDTMSNLRNLWLGRNKIAQIDGLACLNQLNRLDLQNNRITQLTGLDSLLSLEELYLAHNGIARIDGVSSLTRLVTLDLSRNFLTELSNLEKLLSLEELWCSNNNVSTWSSVEYLTCLPSLHTVYLEGNPVAGAEDSANYRQRASNILTSLTQLDALPVQRSRLLN